MDSSKKLIIFLIAIIVILSGTFYFVYNSLSDKLQEKENKILVLNQNTQALKDEVNSKDSIIQNKAVFVKNLQNENKSLNEKYKILQTNFTILYDSIEVLNEATTAIISGDSITVPFVGTQNRVDYSGSTTYNVLNKLASYSISIIRRPDVISSTIYMDSLDILRNKIYANGNLISNAKTDIDSTIYLKIATKYKQVTNLGFFDKLNVFVDAEYNNGTSTIIVTNTSIVEYRKFNIYYGIEYNFENGFTPKIQKNIFDSKDLFIGLKYNASIKKIFKLIF